MKLDIDRIPTTHVGSLPRPDELRSALMHGASHEPDEAFRGQVRAAVDEVVGRQVAAGIDVISDGEMGKPGFIIYVADRLAGVSFEPNPIGTSPTLPADLLEHPDAIAYARRGVEEAAEEGAMREESMAWVNSGPVEYAHPERLAADLEIFRAAVDGEDVVGAFVPASSPFIAAAMRLDHYSDREELYEALARAFAVEYRSIVDAGFYLQIDLPEIPAKHWGAPDLPLDQWREHVRHGIGYLNKALAGIDPERVRVHLCWGNYPGPHDHDLPIRDVLDLVYEIDASGISLEAANPRHEHEWKVFEELPLPEGKYVIPGVIDVCAIHVEHPEVVAQRIERYASVVGRENVVASTDCGFGTSAGRDNLPRSVVWAKLASLAEGARLASQRLWN
jgi:5-methyltetrahydropteroyltriglutamate--homocysteine methyltransferase